MSICLNINLYKDFVVFNRDFTEKTGEATINLNIIKVG